jgi:hypothetical protein
MDIGAYKQKLLHKLITPHGTMTDVVNINAQYSDLFHDAFVAASNDLFDFEWFKKSIEYTQSLSCFEKFILRSYSHNGDALISKFILDGEIITTRNIVLAVQIFKLFDELDECYFNEQCDLSEEGINLANELIDRYKLDISKHNASRSRLTTLINDYINDLRLIISNGPTNAKECLVFRGIQTDYIDTRSEWMNYKTFTSATYSLDIACTFRKSCIYEIRIMPNTPCIALEYISAHPKEKEILIIDKALFKIKQTSEKYTLNTSKMDISENKYVDWTYMINKIFEPTYDLLNDPENNNNNYALTPKQIEIVKSIYCSIDNNIHVGGSLSRFTIRNKRSLNKTLKRKSNKSTENYTRWTVPMVPYKVFTTLSEPAERKFYQHLLDTGGDKDMMERYKALYPEMKKTEYAYVRIPVLESQ